MKKLAIIGFGRFGELFADLARDNYDVCIVESSILRQELARDKGYRVKELTSVSEAEAIVLAVPISNIEAIIKSIAPLIKPEQLVMDVCSVKVHPARVMQQYLPDCHLIASHPMFGPDSAARGLTHLKVAFCPVRAHDEAANEWRNFWQQKNVEVLETTPEEHDQQAAYSQALPYTIAHILNGMKLPDLAFTTRSSEALYDIAKYSAKDSEQLYRDMLAYNPFAKKMLDQFEQSIHQTLEIAHAEANTKAFPRA